MKDCIFCKIINRELPSDIVYEDEKVIAFKDINPQAPIHILICPKKHIETVNDIKEEDKDIIGHIFLVAKKLAKDLNVDRQGYRIIVNCNKDGGQEIYHIHFHFLAGRPLGKLVC